MTLTQLVGRTTKLISTVACVIGALVGWLMTLLLAGRLIADRTLYYNGKPIWIGGVILGYFSFALSWFAYRLIRRPLPTKDGTMMPRWFIVTTIAFFIGCYAIAMLGRLLNHTK